MIRQSGDSRTTGFLLSMGSRVGNCTQSIWLLLLIALASGCQSHLVTSDYSPRLSVRGNDLKRSLDSRKNHPILIIHPFIDERTTLLCPGRQPPTFEKCGPGSIDSSPFPPEPNWIYGFGRDEYEFSDTTVAEFLREALIFDLERYGFLLGDSTSLREGQGGLGHNRPGPDERSEYVVQITVYRAEANLKYSFGGRATPFYNYEYGIVVKRPYGKKALLDEKVVQNISGITSARVISETHFIDAFLNDGLATMNLAVAEILEKFN